MHELVAQFYRHRNLLLRFSAEATGKAVALALALLLARALGTTGYAAIGNANLVTAATLPLLSFGLSFSLVRVTAGLTKGLPVATRYYTSLALAGFGSLLFAILFWISAPYITDLFFDEPKWLNFVRLIAVYGLFSVLELLTMETLRARQQVATASFLQIIAALASLSVCVILYWQDLLTPISALSTLTTLRIVTTIAAHFLLIADQQITLKPSFCNWHETKQALLFGLPFAASGFGTWLIEHGDRFVLTTLMAQEDFGRYLGALVVLSVIPVCGAPFWYLLFPKLAQAHSTNDQLRFAEEGRKALTGFVTVIVPVGIFVAVALPDLLPALAGIDYQINQITSLILVMSLLVIQAGSPWEYACIVEGKSKPYLLRTLFYGSIGVILGAIFIPYLGLMGAALSALMARTGLGVSLYKLASKVAMDELYFPIN